MRRRIPMIQEAFHLGGWGMWPTFFFGVALLGAAAWYGARPARRLVPLLMSGALGFVTGVVRSFTAIEYAGQEHLALIGVGESLHNVAWALVLVMVAMLPVAVGAFRVARAPEARETPAT